MSDVPPLGKPRIAISQAWHHGTMAPWHHGIEQNAPPTSVGGILKRAGAASYGRPDRNYPPTAVGGFLTFAAKPAKVRYPSAAKEISVRLIRWTAMSVRSQEELCWSDPMKELMDGMPSDEGGG